MLTCAILLPTYVLIHKGGSLSVPFPCVRAAEIFGVLAQYFKMRFNDFVAVLQIYVHLNTFSQLKSVMLQRNCNLLRLNCNMTKFHAVVSARNL
jgi:hypothetical protein